MSQQTSEQLDRCLAEQAESRTYLDGDGPDKDGAMRGALDWMVEECLIRLEGEAPAGMDGLA